MHKRYRWRSEDGFGLEHLDLRFGDDVIVAEGTVVGGQDDPDGPYGCHYRVCCDSGWRVRSVEVAVAGGVALVLTSDGGGVWRDGDGAALPMLDGCIDVDISATPFTNTLPIRRLGPRLDARTELFMAWINVSTLAVHRAPQAYTRKADGRYHFEALDIGFEALLEVDGDGMVRDYPGLFRRVDVSQP